MSRRNEINGKYVDIKRAEDNKTREKVEKSSCKVFVGGIEGSVTTEELKDFFQNYGDVKEAVVLRNINTNASRGFGFVTFEDKRVADSLIRENNCVLKGKRMDIKTAEPKDSNSQRQPDRRGGYGGNMHRGMGHDSGYRQPPVDYYQGGYQRGGYQPRDKYAQDYDYMPNQYDHYPPQTQPASRYSDYNMPRQVDPAPVATIAPYAPPAATQGYKSYQAPAPAPSYNYGQPSHMTQDTKVDLYSNSQYMSSGGYSRQQPATDNMYGSRSMQSYGQPTSQPSYQQYGSKGQSGKDQYLSGPSRDYNQSKTQRYKPY